MAKTRTRKKNRRTSTASLPRSSGPRAIGATRPSSTATRAGRTVAVETLRQQADRLGLLDPLDVEPATVYSPDGSDA